MEFSFEYVDFLKGINNNIAIIQSLAYIGILILYIPYRFLISLFKQAPDGKMNILGLLYFSATWFLGAIIIGIMLYNDQATLKLFLVWAAIAFVNLIFILTNHSLLYKIYQTKVNYLGASPRGIKRNTP
ncbi:hypothetical protein [Zobellia galactanivorans]|uniref:hypothetical protein n=1 Tax=Zobellia galactanivorans (strain DSM 12802 / CCUG 47099 / CIP 106680 / NCIMB 13871 / Dsij) TaxID=63186 RepID=UPI001C07D341|nr:hypothetical protein [Zobellia galactanivorans]MBU3024055.1 hypothetical protein [Zobellia galactanivorans]